MLVITSEDFAGQRDTPDDRAGRVLQCIHCSHRGMQAALAQLDGRCYFVRDADSDFSVISVAESARLIREIPSLYGGVHAGTPKA